MSQPSSEISTRVLLRSTDGRHRSRFARQPETRGVERRPGANLSPVATDVERARFVETGLLRLDGAIPADDAAAMQATVWRYVERRAGIRLDDRSTWPGPHAINFRGLKRDPVIRSLFDGGAVRAALDAFFGPDEWARPTSGAQVLLTFPSPGPWILPHGGWHTDFWISRPSWPVLGVKVFAFLSDVEPGGGGTLVLSGSHRLVERFTEGIPSGTPGNNRLWARLLRGDPWLHDVDRAGPEPERTQRLLGAEHVVDGVPIGVVELTGRPGDVVLTHMDVLHTTAPNVRPTPRVMLGKNITRAGAGALRR
jgi:hypothetical protein